MRHIQDLKDAIRVHRVTPEYNPNIGISHLWEDLYARPTWDSFSEDTKKGWQTDWMRASRLKFLSLAAERNLTTSNELRPDQLTVFLMWLRGERMPPCSRADQFQPWDQEEVMEERIEEAQILLELLHDAIWRLAGEMARAQPHEYYRRVPREGIPADMVKGLV